MTFDAANAIVSGVYQWTGRRVLVTGGAGFVGSYLVEDLLVHGATVRVVDDLSTGSFENLAHLGEVELVDGGVERVLMVSSSCVYPDDAPIPTPELPVHVGLPESVNEGYGWGKRLLEIQSRYVHEKYELPIAIVRPFNAYGGRYRWQGEASHVVPSLVKKVLDRNGPVVVWGSGQQVRDLLHARDFALGFRLATECAVDCDPINLAAGQPIRLLDLVQKVGELADLDIEVELDRSKPEGRAR